MASFLQESYAVLERTPATLTALLSGLPAAWTDATDGPGTWSPYVVIGHLIHGERADWMPRLEIILEHGPSPPFAPFDRDAQFQESAGRTMDALLGEFTDLRNANLARLRALNLKPGQLDLQGTHPAFGLVTVRQLLATWTAHDSRASGANQPYHGPALPPRSRPMGGVSLRNALVVSQPGAIS